MFALFLVVAVGCSDAAPVVTTPATIAPGTIRSGPLSEALRTNLDEIFADPLLLEGGDIGAVADAGDVRAAWPLVDLLRFHQGQVYGPRLADALAALVGHGPEQDAVPWVHYSDVLLASDVPAPTGYFDWKRSLYLAVHERWEPFFDPEAELDWRAVTWGGVLRDGIVSLDDPPMVPATGGDWLAHDDVVFGVVINGEARAYPRRVLEVHEMVNDTSVGTRFALSYCTLCRSAIPFRTGDVDGMELELRTSGLLLRSNKLAYDVSTESLFEQFTGRAVSGPLRGITLEVLPVVTTTWGEWRADHPDTLVLPEQIGGRTYGAEQLADLDALPAFPIGDVDDRLPSHEVVFGVRTPDAGAVAFPVEAARRALRAGAEVELEGVSLHLVAGGLRASFEGREVLGHEAFWFAWSGFVPRTRLWGS